MITNSYTSKCSYKEAILITKLLKQHRKISTGCFYQWEAGRSFQFRNFLCGDFTHAPQSAEIKVSFDPAVHRDDTDLGDIIRTIYVETDNPNFPRLTSTITAKVIKK